MSATPHAAAARWSQLARMWAAELGPALPGAACAGRAPLFDDVLPGETPDARQERHRLAARTCRACPALAVCRDRLPRLPARTSGVYAGMFLDGVDPPAPIDLDDPPLDVRNSA